MGKRGSHLGQKMADNIRKEADSLRDENCKLPFGAQAELAKRFGVSVNTVSRIINNKIWTGKPRRRPVRPSRSRRYSEEQVKQFKTRVADGEPITHVARDLKINKKIAYDIANGRTWAHVSASTSKSE